MSGAGELRRTRPSGARPASGGDARGLVRPEFGPALPALLRAIPRWASALGVAVVLALLGVFAVAQATGPDDEPALLVHREPDFTMLFREGDLRRVAPREAEYVRLEGRGRFTSLTVTVAPLPRSPGRAQPRLAELPIETERVIDSLSRRHDGLVVLEEGRARVNDAPGYQVRYRSGPPTAARFGHEVLLVPEPPATGAGLRVSLLQRNQRGTLGSGDRRIAYEAKRAFRSLRLGIERP